LSSDPDHAEILRSGPTAWNAWREKNPSTVPDLAGIVLKLSERQMGPINGGPINLKSARLQDAFLRFATLSAADLEAADMTGADLVHARFHHANLSAANVSSALLDHADFAGANLTKVKLCGASLRFATLSAADLEAADMSGADLMHARFDQANLSAANLSNALLDHADFAGANLTKVNLCGASLYHAKNLTEAQLEESIGSDSTILPPHLQASVSWSVARSQTETPALEHRDLRPRVRHTADVDIPHNSSYNRPVCIAGVLLIGVAMVTTLVAWQLMNDAVPLHTSGAQSGSEQSLSEPKPRLDTGEQRLQPSVPEALTEEKAAAEPRPLADAETPPSAASTVVQTETTLEQRPGPETDRATVPQEANAHAEPQAAIGAKRSGEAFGPNEQAPGTPEQGHEPKSNEASEASPLVSAESPVPTSRDGTVTVPDLPVEASEASPLVSAESPVTTSRHGTIPDLSTEASLPDPQLTPATEAPAEALALNTPEHSADSSLSETPPPPVVTAPLPSSVEQKDVETILPHDAGTPPMPVRKPVIQKREVNSNPDRAGTPPKPVRKSVTQKAEVDSKPDRSRRAKGQSFVDKKAEQRPGSGSIADLLAGGL
jgi:uncharacterized protein YjbI with pentapeptide repeats